jgi:hypothetical protein
LTFDRHSRDGGNPGIQGPGPVPLDARQREVDDKREAENKREADDKPDPEFDAMTARLLRREALRRAAEELNTTSGRGLEGMLARISAEVTADAASRTATPTAPKPRL